jgi:hypothetical protein
MVPKETMVQERGRVMRVQYPFASPPSSEPPRYCSESKNPQPPLRSFDELSETQGNCAEALEPFSILPRVVLAGGIRRR